MHTKLIGLRCFNSGLLINQVTIVLTEVVLLQIRSQMLIYIIPSKILNHSSFDGATVATSYLLRFP